VDMRGIPLMPCTPPKARALLKEGKARPKRNKLGLFYIQLTYEQEPHSQPVVVGIDPGSRFEGYSVVGSQDTVVNLMAEAPDHVKQAVKTRRMMRRARRTRKWQRPKHFNNRLNRKRRIPPSTRSRWEAKVRIVPARLHRRQLHRLEASKGGKRLPYGGTRSLGLKRGTLVRHPKYQLCTVG